METVADAHAVLKRYPSLRWMVAHSDAFHWDSKEGGYCVMPRQDGPLAHAIPMLPVVIDRKGDVSLPSLGIADYPNDRERESIPKPPPTKAIAFLCNRFYRQTGHTFLYVHYLDTPANDRIINFNAGATALGDMGMHRSVAYYDTPVSQLADMKERGVTSFAGFPLSGEQVAVLEADTKLTMLNPKFTYHLLNNREDAVNCTGYGLTRLQNIGVPLQNLTGRNVKRQIDNDHLPDFKIAEPYSVQKTIEWRAKQAKTRNKFDLHDAPHKDGGFHEFHLAAFPDSGMVLGYVGEQVGKRFLDDKYLAIDIANLVAHVRDQGIVQRDGSCTPFSDAVIASLGGAPINEGRQPFRGRPRG